MGQATFERSRVLERVGWIPAASQEECRCGSMEELLPSQRQSSQLLPRANAPIRKLLPLDACVRSKMTRAPDLLSRLCSVAKSVLSPTGRGGRALGAGRKQVGRRSRIYPVSLTRAPPGGGYDLEGYALDSEGATPTVSSQS